MMLQELNKECYLPYTKLTEQDSKSKDDKIVYFGVININEYGKTIGAIDIWRSAITKELFCEEKRLGILDIADYIGMPKLDKGYKWAVAINRNRTGLDRWKLVKLTKEGKFRFVDTDDETVVETDVDDYNIVDSNWWTFLVEDSINKNVEITKELNKYE